jgi:GTPase involved in cell partitioning and DNA repair
MDSNSLLEEIKRITEENERYEKALLDIAQVLWCNKLCDMESGDEICKCCGHIEHKRWCAGCIARIALKDKMIPPSGAEEDY